MIGEIGAAIMDRMRQLDQMARRMTLFPALVRFVVWLSGTAALVLAYPATVVTGTGILTLALFAVGPALWPGRFWPTALILLAAVGWLASTTVYAEPVTLYRLVALAGLLYLVHSVSALAAQVPYDAIVSPGVLVRWLVRFGLVVLVTALLAVALLLVPAYTGGRTYLAAAVLGLLVMVALVVLLARVARR